MLQPAMENIVLRYLQRVWRGPAFTVQAGKHAAVIGQGTAKTRMIMKKSSLLGKLPFSPSLVFGQAYMRGDIEIEGSLPDILRGFYQTGEHAQPTWLAALTRLGQKLGGPVSVRNAVTNARHHYDVGNDFYRLWLDPSLTYSCAYFTKDNDTLAAAQQRKLELVCRKVRLQPGHSLLDIGCGWGSLLWHAAEKYGAHVTGITPSREQANYIRNKIREKGLTSQVRVIEGDWRRLSGSYDRLISIGMFEHVGLQHYRLFFQQWRDLMKRGGISLLHTIGRVSPQRPDPWIRKYIFPGGYLPALADVVTEVSRQDMIIADVENLWQHYVKTLAAWSDGFTQHRRQIAKMYNEELARMWWLYLQGSEAGFRWGGLQLWQFVIVKDKSSAWPLNREIWRN
jgi:cyclopropane-fatty-acyl-phospholipid synthase